MCSFDMSGFCGSFSYLMNQSWDLIKIAVHRFKHENKEEEMLRRQEDTSVSVGVGYSKKSCRNYDSPKHKYRFLKEESSIHAIF